MTKHKIDDLFEQKLAGSEFTPSTAAWSKLEGQLAQKKKKGMFFYMSIAASLALLLTFGWFIWRTQAEVYPTETLALNHPIENGGVAVIDSTASQKPAVPSKETVITPREIPTPEVVNKKKEPIKKSTPQPKEYKKPVDKKKIPLIMILNESNIAQNDASEERPNEAIEEMIDQPLSTEELQQNLGESTASNTSGHDLEQPSKESGSIKLIYTLKPAIPAERFAEQAVAEETKTSPFKKAMAFAKNIKENPKGIGNLRDAKNNLLSFNKKNNDTK